MGEQNVRRPLPKELKKAHKEIDVLAKRLGLTFNPVIFEMVNDQDMSELAAYHGYPARWHHWTWGQESLRMKKMYRNNLSIIYEMVVPTDPCYAYLLDVNPAAIQKLVIAHVYGHADFFKNNVWFRGVPSDLVDILADNSYKLEKIRRENGKEKVDYFLERCLSLSNIFDPLEPLINEDKSTEVVGADDLEIRKIKFKEKLPDYMSDYLNPPNYIKKEEKRVDEEKQRRTEIELGIKLPAEPVRDVMGFLL